MYIYSCLLACLLIKLLQQMLQQIVHMLLFDTQISSNIVCKIPIAKASLQSEFGYYYLLFSGA